MLVATLQKDGRRLLAATVHLESYLEDGPVRAAQLGEVFALLGKTEDAVLMGDFNFGDAEEPDSSHLDREYRDVWKVLKPAQPGYTWNVERSPLAKRNSFPKEGSRRLDRILIRSSVWVPEAIRILGDSPVSEERPGIFPSDHFGLCATLSAGPVR